MRCDLSKTEMEILQVLWDNGGEMAPRDIWDIFLSRGKDWKRQTLNTLLLRMEEKGVIEKHWGSVRVLCSELEFRHAQSEEMVQDSFNGSLHQFMAAFTGNSKISPEDAKELEELVERLRRKGEET